MTLINTPSVLLALDALQNRIYSLEEIVNSLPELMNSFPNDEIKDNLLGYINAMDLIVSLMKQEVVACIPEPS